MNSEKQGPLKNLFNPIGKSVMSSTENKKELLKKLPKVDLLLKEPTIKPLLNRYPKKLIVQEIRAFLKDLRADIIGSKESAPVTDYDTILLKLAERAEYKLNNSLKRAVNGLGIILHTGLGRAPYAQDAQRALMDVVAHYCTIQIDPQTGKRGDRYAHVENLICTLSGAEAAMVVNNNAAATLLVLNSLAQGKEVIVSRGELVEIGGSFRIPDVMERSGAKLVEVGTTNRTHLFFYIAAITENTGLILQVHMSNYTIVGFTKIVSLEELAEIAHTRGLPFFHDLGSGAFVDFERWGLPHEPTVAESIKAGADVVCFSGDKLLGGPQCGIIIGKKEVVDKMKKNQLTRALRCDKMTYAVLEATLRLFMDERKLAHEHPVMRMLSEPLSSVKKRCMGLKRRIKTIVGDKVKLRVVEDVTEVGSGSMSSKDLPSWSLSVRSPDLSPDTLAKQLRMCNPPIFGRVHEDRYLINCRTIREDEVKFILKGFEKVFGGKKGKAAQ